MKTEMTRAEIEQLIHDMDYDDINLMLVDGHDNAFLGFAEQPGIQTKIAYSINKMIKNLVRGGMTESEAWEHFYNDIVGSYVGEGTPVFVESFGMEVE